MEINVWWGWWRRRPAPGPSARDVVLRLLLSTRLKVDRIDTTALPPAAAEAIVDLKARLKELLDKLVANESTVFNSVDGFVTTVVTIITDLRKEIVQMDVPPAVAALFDQASAAIDDERTQIQEKLRRGTELAEAPLPDPTPAPDPAPAPEPTPDPAPAPEPAPEPAPAPADEPPAEG